MEIVWSVNEISMELTLQQAGILNGISMKFHVNFMLILCKSEAFSMLISCLFHLKFQPAAWKKLGIYI